MRIACISTSRVPSDTANSIQVMKTVHALAQAGHQVQLFVPGEPGVEGADWEALAEQYGLTNPIPIDWLPAHPRLKRNDFALYALRAAMRWRADLVYTWTIQSAVFALLARLPVIFELHDLPTGKLGPLWFRVFRSLPGRKRLLAITRALRRSVEQRYGSWPDAQVVIAPNGVDLAPYKDLPAPSSARAELGLPEAPTVLCSGHLYSGRGVELFLHLAGSHPHASFVWVGGRPDQVDEFREKSEALQLANVQFTGFVSQRRLPCHLAAADVLLMPYGRSIAGSSGGNSADICSPMKMFDYLAAGRAILSSDLPVIHEVLGETNAVFAPPDDPHGWSVALERLLADDDLRASISARSLADAQLYSWAARARRSLEGMLEK